MKMEKSLNELSKKLRIASDPNRMKILCLLFRNKGICVSEISNKLGLSIAIVSHHLQVLSKNGILQPIRKGKTICYKLTETNFTKDFQNLICKYTKVKSS